MGAHLETLLFSDHLLKFRQHRNIFDRRVHWAPSFYYFNLLRENADFVACSHKRVRIAQTLHDAVIALIDWGIFTPSPHYRTARPK